MLFAAATVIIALGGLFVIGFDFFNGLAVAAVATVLLMMIGATFLLPAVLSLLGRRAFALRMPWARKAHRHDGTARCSPATARGCSGTSGGSGAAALARC